MNEKPFHVYAQFDYVQRVAIRLNVGNANLHILISTANIKWRNFCHSTPN